MGNYFVMMVSIAVLFLFIMIVAMLKRYKRCPSDRILVVYGKVGKGIESEYRSAKCIHGGAAFIWPVIQSYQFLDLTPISIEINLRSALSKQNIRVDVPSRFTVGISTEVNVMTNAAERLLGLTQETISNLAKDIIFGQLRLVVATMDIEEINDESGYIEALGKEAAAKAINDAKKSVAEKNRDGEIGQAEAHQAQRVQVAKADAVAVEGENLAKITIANSDADRREKQAEASRKAVAAEKVTEAKALEEAYAAEQLAENARALRDKATQTANVVVSAE